MLMKREFWEQYFIDLNHLITESRLELSFIPAFGDNILTCSSAGLELLSRCLTSRGLRT